MPRTRMGPISWNRSWMLSGSTDLTPQPDRPDRSCTAQNPSSSAGRLEPLGSRGRDRHGLAAAAGGGLVRVLENELRCQLACLKVHLGTEKEQHGLRVDKDLHALVFHNLVQRIDALRIIHRVGHASATAVLHADANADDGS